VCWVRTRISKEPGISAWSHSSLSARFSLGILLPKCRLLQARKADSNDHCFRGVLHRRRLCFLARNFGLSGRELGRSKKERPMQWISESKQGQYNGYVYQGMQGVAPQAHQPPMWQPNACTTHCTTYRRGLRGRGRRPCLALMPARHRLVQVGGHAVLNARHWSDVVAEACLRRTRADFTRAVRPLGPLGRLARNARVGVATAALLQLVRALAPALLCILDHLTHLLLRAAVARHTTLGPVRPVRHLAVHHLVSYIVHAPVGRRWGRNIVHVEIHTYACGCTCLRRSTCLRTVAD
jgi:hypothetical protein